MAKKSVASLQTGSKRLSKAIKMVKSPKTGAYTFVESITDPKKLNEFLAKKYILFTPNIQATFYLESSFFYAVYLVKFERLKILNTIHEFF